MTNLSGKPELAAVERELRLALAEKMILDFDYLPLPAIPDAETRGRAAAAKRDAAGNRATQFAQKDANKDGKLSFEEFSAGRGAEEREEVVRTSRRQQGRLPQPRGIRSRFAAAQEELTRRAMTIAITTLATICLPGSPHAGAAASQPLTLSDKKVAAADQPKILLLLAADHGWLDNSVFGAGEVKTPTMARRQDSAERVVSRWHARTRLI